MVAGKRGERELQDFNPTQRRPTLPHHNHYVNDCALSAIDRSEVESLKVQVTTLRNETESMRSEITHSVGALEERLGQKLEKIVDGADLEQRVLSLEEDLEQTLTIVDEKASIDEVNEALAAKANKKSVGRALHRKVNKTDLEAKLRDL